MSICIVRCAAGLAPAAYNNASVAGTITVGEGRACRGVHSWRRHAVSAKRYYELTNLSLALAPVTVSSLLRR